MSVLLVTMMSGSPGMDGNEAATEYELKAAYVYNILRLVQRTGRQQGEFVTLCTYAAGPIEQALRALEGSSLGGRRLRIKTSKDAPDMKDCDAAFFGRSNGAVSRMLAEANNGGLLTIGNDESFVPMGGMISLFVESRRVVVEVNPAAAAAAGWVVSSHLLDIARVVREPKR